MSKATDITMIIIGALALLCVNGMAFVFDGQWINTAIALDSSFVGALIYKFLSKST